ncbi:MAG: serine/threonine-protein kinase [Solirubrobacterales bacterium]
MQRERPRWRVFGLLVVGLVAAAIALIARDAGWLGWVERDSVDARFSLRGGQGPPPSLVVVGIDNESLARLPRYPFSRRLDARVLENLHRAGARLIVFDLSFDRPTRRGADSALYEAARRGAPVLFATSLISPHGATEVLGGNANLTAIGDQAAAADLVPDPDGVLRHTIDRVNGLPSIAAAASRRLGRTGQEGLLSGGWIDYRGPPGTVREIPFVRVMENDFRPDLVRGKVVVIGATAPVLQDLHQTSVGGPMPGAEVQAAAISTTLDSFPLRDPATTIELLLIVGVALLVPIAGIWLESTGMVLVGLGGLVLWSAAAQIAFDSGVVLDYADPLAALMLGALGAVSLGLWDDGRERRRLRLLFAAGNSTVVEQVLHAEGEHALQPTKIIAGYRLEEVIGRGGMGVVYRATQEALQRPVAVKLIASERASDPVFRERFKSESRIAASIDHASVIPVYEAGEDDELLFIAMRLVNGGDLAQVLAHLGALEPARVARIAFQVGGALDVAHAHGLVHRDIKPANVLLTLEEPEHAYLTDFGVAKAMGSAPVTAAGEWVGTLDYMAPEQIRGETVDARADIYALAAVLYQCVAGQVPFPRADEPAKLWAHLNSPPPLPSQAGCGLPAQLDEVIAKGMAKDPRARFPSAGELARAFAEAVGIPVEAPPPPPQLGPDEPLRPDPAGRSDRTASPTRPA